MSHDAQTPPGVQVEITVPVFQFPRLPDFARQEDTSGAGTPDIEQVRLHRLDPAAQAGNDQDRPAEEVATYSARRLLFRQFRLRQIPTLGQRFAVQVWRRWQRTQAVGKINDECVLSVSFARASDTVREELWPGVNQIVVQLDTEDVPTNYSIDGTHSEE